MFEKGKLYKYGEIEDFTVNDDDYSMTEYGPFHIGNNFIVLEHGYHNIIISFVLSSHGSASIYECIYSDLK